MSFSLIESTSSAEATISACFSDNKGIEITLKREYIPILHLMCHAYANTAMINFITNGVAEYKKVYASIDHHNMIPNSKMATCVKLFNGTALNANSLTCQLDESIRYIIGHYPCLQDEATTNETLSHGHDVHAQALPQGDSPANIWKMIWEREITHIIVLSREHELGERVGQCYWPRERRSGSCTFGSHSTTGTLVYDGITISLKEDKFCGSFIRNVLDIRHATGQKRTIILYEYLDWLDQQTANINDLLLFISCYHQDLDLIETPANTFVHCRAGISRSGTFVILDTIIRIFRKKQSVFSMSSEEGSERDLVVDIYKQYRKQRNIYPTMDQFKSIYEALKLYCKNEVKISNMS
jgi:protein tyrosine phosphatase